MAVDVHQCPRCELRFPNTAELRDHFSLDHAADPDTFERYRYPARSAGSVDPGTGRRYLVVANQTLQGDELAAAVRERAGRGDATFFVLVPATHSAAHAAPPSTAPDHPDPEGPPDADDLGLAMARWRLRTTIDALRSAGVEAEGQIGHPDPFTAVNRIIAGQRFDEILLSTLPSGVSRWLGVDLPKRLERRCNLPVTTVTARS